MFIYPLIGIIISCSSSKYQDTSTSEIIPPFEVETPMELVLIPERPQDISISADGTFFISSQTGDYLYRLQKTIDEIVNSLVPILLMKDEIQLGERITRPNANSDFTKVFSSRSIKDSKGRSLRDLKFNKTIFKHSCSYMIYSKSFVSLPEVLKNAVFKRIKDILNIKNKE